MCALRACCVLRRHWPFAGPPDQSAAWSDSGAEGCWLFLRRLWAFGVKRQAALATAESKHVDGASPKAAELRSNICQLLKQVSHDFERLQYNTVLSGTMKMLNTLEDAKLSDSPADRDTLCESISILLRCLYPAAPHMTSKR